MKTKSWNFDTDKAGELPKGFEAAAGTWKVAADVSAPSKANVLTQTAKSEKSAYNVLLISDTNYKNLDLSVKFKAVAGEIDQGGGVVWRAKDAQNYYICRYNPLEENFRVYKVEAGKRTQLGTADIPAKPGWHTVQITMLGDKIECHYDGDKRIEVTDSTFPNGGKIGLWSKADAQTSFDDLTVFSD